MSKPRGSARRGRRGIAVVVALAITCGAVFLASAGPASAGNLIVCGGSITPANPKKPGTDAKYQVQCDEDIRGFSVISTSTVDFFGSETDVAPTTSQSATLQCEGTVPGNGFGCGITNQYSSAACGSKPKPSCATAPPCGQPTTVQCTSRVSAGNAITGEISFEKSPCVQKPKIWVIGVNDAIVTTFTPAGDTYTVGEYGSQPWRLRVKGFKKSKCASAVKADEKAKAKAKK